MAKSRLILQGLKPDVSHADEVKKLLNDQDATRFIISVAFARLGGVSELSSELEGIFSKLTMFVGISNGVTSFQALSLLLELGVQPYLVDMGDNQRIFHPKVFAAFSEEGGQVIVGSANLTESGLYRNIEIGSYMDLAVSDPQDQVYIDELKGVFATLPNDYPYNIQRVFTKADLQVILQEGRLEDESVCVPNSAVGSAKRGTGRGVPPFPYLGSRRTRVSRPGASSPAGSVNSITSQANNSNVVWRSKGLTERDLSIPRGKSTNPTGSMYLTKGLLEGIDQRHYFREDVFESLSWVPDTKPNLRHLERATATFEIIINGTLYGPYTLKLTHNTNTESETYKQKNAMTQIHWGEAKNIVRDRSLINKTMTIYQLSASSYRLEIN